MVAWQWVQELLKMFAEFQVGIEPATCITLFGCANHWAAGTPGGIGRLTAFFFTQSVLLTLWAWQCDLYSRWRIWKTKWHWMYLCVNDATWFRGILKIFPVVPSAVCQATFIDILHIHLSCTTEKHCKLFIAAIWSTRLIPKLILNMT